MKKIADVLDLSNLHNKSPSEFEQHKKKIVLFMAGKLERTLADKISESLPLGLASPVKTPDSVYAAFAAVFVKHRQVNQPSVTPEGKLNQQRLFELVHAIIIHHHNMLTPELFKLWPACAWSTFLGELYQKADFDNVPVGARAEKTGVFGSSADKNRQRAQTRMLKIKNIFELFEKLITQSSALQPPLRTSQSEPGLPQKKPNDEQGRSSKLSRNQSKKISEVSLEPSQASHDDNTVIVERRSPKKRKKIRLKSASAAMLPSIPAEWASIYHDIRLSLNSLNAALSQASNLPHAPSFKKERARMDAIDIAVNDLLQQSSHQEQDALLAFDKAESVRGRYDDVKGFEDTCPAVSLEAFDARIALLKARRHQLSLDFLAQDTPARKSYIAGFVHDLTQMRTNIDEKINALNILIAHTQKRKIAFEKNWTCYEAEQKTVLPSIKQQKEAQTAIVNESLSALIEQKKSLLIKLNRKRGAVELDISRFEAAKTPEGYEPIKVCDALMAIFEDKSARLLAEREQLRNELMAQKTAVLQQWDDLAAEEEKTKSKEKAWIALIPQLEEAISTSIWAMIQAKEALISKQRQAANVMAEITSYDDEASVNDKPLTLAIQKLEEDIQALRDKRDYLGKCSTHHKEAQAAKIALKKVIKASRAKLEGLTVPTARCAGGIFKEYKQTLEALNHTVRGAYSDKVVALAMLGQDLKDFANASQAIFQSELSCDKRDAMNPMVSLDAATHHIEALSQSVNQQKHLHVYQTKALMSEIDKELAICEYKSLPKKRAHLCTRIDNALNANIASAPQAANVRLIRDTFQQYQLNLMETRQKILDTDDFLLKRNEKEGYLNRLGEIHQDLQGSDLETTLDELDDEEKEAYEQFALNLKTQKERLNTKIIAHHHVISSSPHPAKGWEGEARFLIYSPKELKIKPMVARSAALTVEEAQNVEHNIEKLTQAYIAQRTAFTEQRAALYHENKTELDTAISAIHTVSSEANKKIVVNQKSALVKAQRGLFYAAIGLAVTSPVLVGVLEGMLAGFIAGIATGGVGLPFWLAGGAIGGGLVGAGISSGTAFFAHKAKQAAQVNVLLQRSAKTLELETQFKVSEFNLRTLP